MKTTCRVALTVCLFLFCQTGGLAQGPKGPIGIAYQFTHSVNDSPTFSPDGQEMVFISSWPGKNSCSACAWTEAK